MGFGQPTMARYIGLIAYIMPYIVYDITSLGWGSTQKVEKSAFQPIYSDEHRLLRP
jgi:hypothetical protein